ncbi:MAG: hypothetical protein JXA74_08450, partial [Anaerolineae bacterium]|nr:hypothetical protein [Anaerolineae bacterium]
WLSLCSPVAAESMACLGYDFLVVDLEHSPIGFETMVNCFRAIQLGGAAPMARVPWNDTVWIQRTLDAGALGLIVPMVNTAEDARRAVSNARYATKGQRSYGGSRLAAYLDDDYRTWADENLAVLALIETIEGVENIEEIVKVEGLTGCHIGHADLALSMGITFAEMGPDTEHEAAMLHVVTACQTAGLAVGKLVASAQEARLRYAQGFRFLAVGSDAAMLTQAAREMLAAVRL